jgi:hypothetical protein
LHEDHTEWISATNQAKLEIIYQRHFEKWTINSPGLSPLQLWEKFDPICLYF